MLGIATVTELLNVESSAQQEKLRFGFPFSSRQKPSEAVILLEHAEGTLNLNQAVHPPQNPVLRYDTLSGSRFYLAIVVEKIFRGFRIVP